MTNKERIKEMNAEELAAIIMCPYDIEEGMCSNETDCISCCKEWLESEEDYQNGATTP